MRQGEFTVRFAETWPRVGTLLALCIAGMDLLQITAAGGMRARLESLELLSNNMANANTAGYKRDSEFYGLYRAELAGEGADVSTPSLPFIERPWIDHRQGTIERTGNATDLAVSGSGYFVVQSPAGTLYTRNGHFRLSNQGVLETAEGYPVQMEEGGDLRLRPERSFEISTDGTVKQEGQTLGKLQLAAFRDTAALTKRGYSYFATGEAPTPATDSQVQQGATESSNVPAAESAIRLVGLTRQFEMLNRAVTVCGDMGRRTIEELGRVSG